MTAPEEKERISCLCSQIVEERDSERFLVLIRELNNLLDKRERAELKTPDLSV